MTVKLTQVAALAVVVAILTACSTTALPGSEVRPRAQRRQPFR